MNCDNKENTLDIQYFDFCRYLAKVIIQLLCPILKDNPQKDYYLMFPSDLGQFIQTALNKKYPWSYIKKLVELHVDCNQYYPCVTFAELQTIFPCEILSDASELESICNKIIADNPKSVSDYKKGKIASLNHLKGQVMKETKGKANITQVEQILKSKLL